MLSIYLEDHDGESRTANYSTFYIDDDSNEYVNHVSWTHLCADRQTASW